MTPGQEANDNNLGNVFELLHNNGMLSTTYSFMIK